MLKTLETVIIFVGVVVLVTILSQQAPRVADALKTKLADAANVK